MSHADEVAVTAPRFAVGPFALVVRATHASDLGELHELFSGFELADYGREVTLEVARRGGRLLATLDGTRVASCAHMVDLGIAITRAINRRVLDAETDRLHLHAGAVCSGSAAVLVIGPSRSGKSTTVAHLVARGWRYFSDEQLGVLPDASLVPYPRPITLRRDSWQLFESTKTLVESIDESVARAEIPPRRLGDVYRGPSRPPSLVIRPDVSVAEVSVTPLTVAAHMALLIEDSLDMERAGQRGIDALLAMIHAAPAFKVSGRDGDEIETQIAALANTASPPPPALRSCVVAQAEASLRVPGTFGWHFGDDSAAVYEPHSGVLAILDSHAYEAWTALQGIELLGSVPAGLQGFAHEMGAAGLLQDAV